MTTTTAAPSSREEETSREEVELSSEDKDVVLTEADHLGYRGQFLLWRQ